MTVKTLPASLFALGCIALFTSTASADAVRDLRTAPLRHLRGAELSVNVMNFCRETAGDAEEGALRRMVEADLRNAGLRTFTSTQHKDAERFFHPALTTSFTVDVYIRPRSLLDLRNGDFCMFVVEAELQDGVTVERNGAFSYLATWRSEKSDFAGRAVAGAEVKRSVVELMKDFLADLSYANNAK